MEKRAHTQRKERNFSPWLKANHSVLDPDLEIRKRGGEGRCPKKMFSALSASVWSKNKVGGGRGGRHSPGSTSVTVVD